MKKELTIPTILFAGTVLFASTLLLLTAVSVQAEDYERCSAEAGECVEMMMENLSQRGWVGINFDAKGENVVLSAVVPDSPAEAAGLEAGDILISVNGVAYSDGNEAKIKEIHAGLRPGEEITIVASRNGTESEHLVTLGKRICCPLL